MAVWSINLILIGLLGIPGELKANLESLFMLIKWTGLINGPLYTSLQSLQLKSLEVTLDLRRLADLRTAFSSIQLDQLSVMAQSRQWTTAITVQTTHAYLVWPTRPCWLSTVQWAIIGISSRYQRLSWSPRGHQSTKSHQTKLCYKDLTVIPTYSAKVHKCWSVM